jgi:hypothetical protein
MKGYLPGLKKTDLRLYGSVALTTQKFAVTSLTSGGRPSVSVACELKATQFVCLRFVHNISLLVPD